MIGGDSKEDIAQIWISPLKGNVTAGDNALGITFGNSWI